AHRPLSAPERHGRGADLRPRHPGTLRQAAGHPAVREPRLPRAAVVRIPPPRQREGWRLRGDLPPERGGGLARTEGRREPRRPRRLRAPAVAAAEIPLVPPPRNARRADVLHALTSGADPL